MAYRRRSPRSRYSSRYSSTRRRYAGTRRRRTSRRSSRTAQRIVIQVVGGPSGVPVSPVTLGKKAGRVVRSRF